MSADDGLKEKMYFQGRLPSIGAFVPGPWSSHSTCRDFLLQWLLKHIGAFLPRLWVLPHRLSRAAALSLGSHKSLNTHEVPVPVGDVTCWAGGRGREDGMGVHAQAPVLGRCLGSRRCSVLQRGEL